MLCFKEKQDADHLFSNYKYLLMFGIGATIGGMFHSAVIPYNLEAVSGKHFFRAASITLF